MEPKPTSLERSANGIQDIPTILAASKVAGADWVVVEQDESVGRSTLEAAKLSIDYLRSLEEMIEIK